MPYLGVNTVLQAINNANSEISRRWRPPYQGRQNHRFWGYTRSFTAMHQNKCFCLETCQLHNIILRSFKHHKHHFFNFIFFHIPQKLLLLHVTFSHGCSYPHKTTEILDPRKSMHKVAFPGEKNTNELILHLKYSHLENWTIWNWTLSVLIKGWSHVYFSSKLLLW